MKYLKSYESDIQDLIDCMQEIFDKYKVKEMPSGFRGPIVKKNISNSEEVELWKGTTGDLWFSRERSKGSEYDFHNGEYILIGYGAKITYPVLKLILKKKHMMESRLNTYLNIGRPENKSYVFVGI